MDFGISAVLAPLKPLLAAGGQSFVDALLNANPDISEEELREKLKSSTAGVRKYPVIRIKLSQGIGVKFWKMYEDFFNDSVLKIAKKAGLNVNEIEVIDPRVKFSVSAKRKEELDKEKGMMSKLGDRLSNIATNSRYAYTNLYPPEFYKLNIITELQLDYASEFFGYCIC
ncbi:hypothetical protein [Piscirickettsia litoralis]|uniref:Uncharacterized protein n=1 Tax=Piscirickettsia litoralis TaxID=1891921 RepID=A0ABX3A2F9_9GAMM|nr:hypothetical protein [Piscirickettsia litoralis]ODN41635.1 hypothetical protein BGC07_16205 [Piscirickettsia litoralis]